jgi:hypothetical protein
MPKADRYSLIGRALALALFLGGAAGCSSSPNYSVMLFADPGKYEYHNCQQIQAAGRAAIAREQQLRALIEKAERSSGGGLVGVVAYRGEHRTTLEDIAVIEATARRKNCLTTETWRSNTAIQ